MMRSPKRFPVPLVHINETNSTNNYLQTLCARQQTEEFTTVVADFQTSGRGQRGNSWESAPGMNLTFSTVLYPSALKAREQFTLSMLIALSVYDTLRILTPPIFLLNGRTIFIGKIRKYAEC